MNMKLKASAVIAAVILACFAAPIFAHQKITDERSVEYKVEKIDPHRTAYLTYNNVSKNLMVRVVVDDDFYDEADTITWIITRVKAFTEEKDFKHYRNYSEDIIKWKNENVEYTRFVILYNDK